MTTPDTTVPNDTAESAVNAPPSPAFLAWIYAAVPSTGALIWLLSGEGNTLRMMGNPIDFLPVFHFLLIFTALRTGVSRQKYLALPSPLDRAALIGLLAILAYGLALVALQPIAGALGLAYTATCVTSAIFLGFLILKAGTGFETQMTWAVFLHVALHLPLLALFYLLYIDDPALNWRGGPIGYWHVRIWAMFLAVAIAVGLGLVLRSTEARQKLLLWGLITILIGLLFWSGSRASVLGLGASVLFSVLLFPKRTWRLLPPLCVATAAGIALSFLPEIPGPAYGIFNSLSETVDSETLDGSSGGRMTMWRDALALVPDRPLFGYGFDQYQFNNFGRFEWAMQPHNVIVNLLVQVGVVGTALAVFLMFRFWLRGLLHIRRSGSVARIGAFMGLNALLVVSLFDGALYHPEPLTLAAILTGLLLHPGADVDSPARAA